MACHIRCAYGDSLIWGQNSYNGSKCRCNKCPNYELCGSWVTKNRQCCKICEKHLNKRVLRVDKTEDVDCAICLSVQKGSVQWACGHKFCINCIKYYVNVDDLVLPKYDGVYSCDCDVCKGDKYPFCDNQLLRFIMQDRGKVGNFGVLLATEQERWKKQRCGVELKCPLCRSGL